MTTLRKRLTIAIALGALLFAGAAGCGGEDVDEPRPPVILNPETGEQVAIYDDTTDCYMSGKWHIPADLVTGLLDGRFQASWDGTPAGLAEKPPSPGHLPLPRELVIGSPDRE